MTCQFPTYVELRAEEDHLGMQVRAAARDGSEDDLNAAQNAYFASLAARYIAAHRVRKDRARKARYGIPSKETQAAAAAQLALEIDVTRPCGEAVYIEAVNKGEGEYRLTCAYGELAQARQQLIVNLLRWREALPHAQTVLNGGRDAAIRKVQMNFAAGSRHNAELDVRRCFKSFRTENLSGLLRLPESVVEHVISIHSLVPVPSRTCRRDVLHHLPDDPETPEVLFQALLGAEWEQARLGLPEGSRLSPVLAELLLTPVVRALGASRQGRVLTYADNFFLSATSEARLHWMIGNLQDRLARHPAGPVTVRDDFAVRRPDEPFDFLGYRLTPRWGQLEVTWAAKHEEHARRLRREAYKLLRSDMPGHRKLEVLARVEREHTAFTRNFGAWPGRLDFNDEKLAKLRRVLFPRGGPEGTPSRRRS
ncbi:reverse transcriptase domain-containing protein [Neotabrizicola sp. VNH66]|uniref:reverse transcriptase domain-containing protein n=1 Tax=Neotabrizicola sp. VNH66 TaxID=3400918 RepID=UPI003C039EE7